jgi:hypothetical protein
MTSRSQREGVKGFVTTVLRPHNKKLDNGRRGYCMTSFMDDPILLSIKLLVFEISTYCPKLAYTK